MALLIDGLKVRAAAGSMHQFCPVVRDVFPGEADDKVVESITLFLYLNLARDIFGRRFTRSLAGRLCGCLKFTSPAEVRSRLGRMSRKATRVREFAESMRRSKTPETSFHNHIASIVQTMLAEAGQPNMSADERARTFERFDAAVRKMKDHLLGIRRQNHFLMKS